jgi:hypothetical protein
VTSTKIDNPVTHQQSPPPHPAQHLAKQAKTPKAAKIEQVSPNQAVAIPNSAKSSADQAATKHIKIAFCLKADQS